MYVQGYLQGSENDRVVTIAPLKPLSQMNWNLVEKIYGRSSIKNAHFVPIH
jgi:hypothetical protein